MFTSGEETWKYLKTRPDGLGQRLGRRVYAIMPDRDAGILEGLDLQRVTDVGAATFVLVTGIEDVKTQAKDFDPVLQAGAARRPADALRQSRPDGASRRRRGDLRRRDRRALRIPGRPRRLSRQAAWEDLRRDLQGARRGPRPVPSASAIPIAPTSRGAQDAGAKGVLVAGGIHRSELLYAAKIEPEAFWSINRDASRPSPNTPSPSCSGKARENACSIRASYDSFDSGFNCGSRKILILAAF